MPHAHGVDYCSHGFFRKGRKLDLGESRSPTQIVQRNMLHASHRLWAYVCAFWSGADGDDGDDGDGDGDSVGDGNHSTRST